MARPKVLLIFVSGKIVVLTGTKVSSFPSSFSRTYGAASVRVVHTAQHLCASYAGRDPSGAGSRHVESSPIPWTLTPTLTSLSRPLRSARRSTPRSTRYTPCCASSASRDVAGLKAYVRAHRGHGHERAGAGRRNVVHVRLPPSPHLPTCASMHPCMILT
jgi:hypothetical protein